MPAKSAINKSTNKNPLLTDKSLRDQLLNIVHRSILVQSQNEKEPVQEDKALFCELLIVNCCLIASPNRTA